MSGGTLLVVGNDKIAARALAALPPGAAALVAVDRSTSLRRVIRLVRRGSLSIGLVARMFWCELRRPAARAAGGAESIRCNADLVALIERQAPCRVVLFRAGLIINRAVLATGVPIMNVHCAKVPDFGGIGSIDRALRAGALDQCATLHQVTESIDDGAVIATEPYRLERNLSYCENEDRAYQAGQRLLLRILAEPDLPAGAGGRVS